jgi:hypothetical protein
VRATSSGVRSKAQPIVESIILVGGNPAILALPISLASNLCQDLLFEVVIGCYRIDRRAYMPFSSLEAGA